MKPATVPQIKKELTHLSKIELIELCLRLSKFKKENKEGSTANLVGKDLNRRERIVLHS